MFVHIMRGAVAAAVLALLAAPAAFAQDSPAPDAVYYGHAEPAAPEFGFAASTLLRSDERGVGEASLVMPHATLRVGGDGNFGDHDTMHVFGSLTVRVGDVAGSFLSSLDWGGGLGNWQQAGRLTWWPQPFASIWLEFNSDAARFGVDAEGRADWFVVGGSAWMATDKGVGIDLYVGAALDGLRLRVGVLGMDATAPAWWGRGPAPSEFAGSVYASIGWQG